MNVQINQPLKNGTIDILKTPGVAGFIIGALEAGFTVRMPGAVFAIKKTLQIMSQTMGDNPEVVFLVRGQIMHKRPLDGFDWSTVSVRGGYVFCGGDLICGM